MVFNQRGMESIERLRGTKPPTELNPEPTAAAPDCRKAGVRQRLQAAHSLADLGAICDSSCDGVHAVRSHAAHLHKRLGSATRTAAQDNLPMRRRRLNRAANLGSAVHDHRAGVTDRVENASDQPAGLCFGLLLLHRHVAAMAAGLSVLLRKSSAHLQCL